MVEFFESLSFIGWLGVGVWILFIIVQLVRPYWFVNYERRLPKSNIFDEYTYTEFRRIVFLILRYVVILLVLSVVTKIMFIL